MLVTRPHTWTFGPHLSSLSLWAAALPITILSSKTVANDLSLLDWEYAGYDAELFDLANLSSNNELSPEQEGWLLETYFKKKVTDRLRRQVMAMKCVSLLRETLWSINSEIHSTLEFDYMSYTKKNLTRFERAYEEFQQML